LTLASLGWDAAFAHAFRPYESAGLVPARVAVRHHGPCVVLTELGALGGMPSGKLGEADLPAVGDWVAARPLPGERRTIIEAVLPRRTAFLRQEAWRRTAAQVLAANVDVAFVVSAFGRDLNPRRLERYLTLAWESGAEPVIVVTKADRSSDPERELAPVRQALARVPTLVASSVTGLGLEDVRGRLGPGRTGVLLGSSGVGKSTLANRLLGRAHFPTRELRRDERGRHTTARRELVSLPGGGVLIDTPGLRELQLWGSVESVERTFDDIAELALGCRFRDCAHDREPGCAVLAAVEGGALTSGRLAGFRKLRRELEALEARVRAGPPASRRKRARKRARTADSARRSRAR
jgi:ribosome biogenesis GTPase